MVTCSGCGNVLDEASDVIADQRVACPTCGSKSRVFKVHLTGSLLVTSSLTAKGFEAGEKKPFVKIKSEDSFFRQAQRWVKRTMRVDRRNNRYTEQVTDPQTGETIHSSDEPLTDHRGHGSAKAKRDA